MVLFARLFWRRLDTRETADTDEQEIITNLLTHMSHDVRHHFVGAEQFNAEYGLLVTWHRTKWSFCTDPDTCEVRFWRY